MSEFTSEPWKVRNKAGCGAAVYSGKRAIATVYDSANAPVIAAALDLYDACKGLLDAIQSGDSEPVSEIVAAVSALRKAEEK